MRRLVASVCLITTGDKDGPKAGLTATAVCSVAADPPTLLCCVNRSNSSYNAILSASVFAVNVLALEDRQIADHFAGRLSPAEKFEKGLWRTAETGAPLLESALAAFDCRLAQHVEVGTHGILFGAIQEVSVRPGDAKPLIYAQAGYGGFASFESARSADMIWNPQWDHADAGGFEPAA